MTFGIEENVSYDRFTEIYNDKKIKNSFFKEIAKKHKYFQVNPNTEFKLNETPVKTVQLYQPKLDNLNYYDCTKEQFITLGELVKIESHELS